MVAMNLEMRSVIAQDGQVETLMGNGSFDSTDIGLLISTGAYNNDN